MSASCAPTDWRASRIMSMSSTSKSISAVITLLPIVSAVWRDASMDAPG